MARRNAVKLRWLLPLMAVVLLAALPAYAQWQIEPIAPTGSFAAPPALTFDSQNRPFVAYQPASGSVKLANGMASGGAPTWTTPTSIPGLWAGYDLGALHLATAGTSVYAGYTSYDNSYGLQRAVFSGGSWQNLPADFGPGFIGSPQLGGMATDGNGQACWIYNPAGPGSTSSSGTGYRLLTQTGPTTTATTNIVSGLQNGINYYFSGRPDDIFRLDGDMAFDRSGNLHTVQYYEIGSHGFLMYAKGPQGGPFVVQDDLDGGWWAKTGRPSLAVDAAGKAHIAYTTLWPYYQLNYLTQTDTGWDKQTIDLGGTVDGYVGTFPDVLIDPKGLVHVVYADGLNGLLKHAKLVGSQWQIETIDTIGKQSVYGPQVGALAAALDGHGNIGVAYWSGAEGTLKYAYLVPEPATVALLALASGVLLRRRR